jgi:antitoxin component YwqK of YwqJK toxin-antitoxin module
MSGEWLSYHENGSLKERVLFENGIENGAFTEFHPNGKLATEGTYHESREHGILKMYDSTGTLFRQMECINGACKTIWLADTLKK